MKRCFQTAEKIAELHNLEVKSMPNLREVEILRKLPPGSLLTDVLSQRRWKAVGERFFKDGRWDAFPLSEGSIDFRNRVRVAMNRVICASDSGVICVVTHGGVINVYLAELLGIDRDYFFSPAHCSICRIGTTRKRQVLISVNDVCHMIARSRSA
jgi:broad specificity phosphatase PhoE